MIYQVIQLLLLMLLQMSTTTTSPSSTDAEDSDEEEDLTEGHAEGAIDVHDDIHRINQPPGIFGYLATPKDCFQPQNKDATTTQQLRESFQRNTTSTSIDFPYISERPVNEYDTTTRLFCKAFPWLFPGGTGDFNDYSEIKETVDEWICRLLYYKDGRFACDKIWAFFALNYALRKKNSESGAYFVNGFFDNGPKTLQELQELLRDGNHDWINRLTYFSYHVKGSPGYWRYKRSEVYSWINHHIEVGHGAPTMFITLSCAEHYWPDIKRLIQERLEAAGDYDTDLESLSYPSIINDYSLVVQEYFQQRVEIWLDTIGKDIFGIKHHWLRYEFAPGRGQIHAHMLAITDHQDVFKDYHAYRDFPDMQAHLLSKWVQDTFGMTASLANNTDTSDETPHPSTIKFKHVSNTRNDANSCLRHLQYHTCGPKCMRKRKLL